MHLNGSGTILYQHDRNSMTAPACNLTKRIKTWENKKLFMCTIVGTRVIEIHQANEDLQLTFLTIEARFGGVLPDGRGLLSASCMQVRLTKALASFDSLD